MNYRRCDICNIVVHTASYAKHIRSKQSLEIEKQGDYITPEWLFQQSSGNKIKKITLKTLKDVARKNINLDIKQLNKELAKKIINPYSFTDKALQVSFIISLDSRHFIYSNSELTLKPKFTEFEI